MPMETILYIDELPTWLVDMYGVPQSLWQLYANKTR